ncbi:MAG: HD domain-containing protein [Gammaproteobacteria bacterium]|nr:HD domain-containing protein [Gammaproteobacteria bacterium]
MPEHRDTLEFLNQPVPLREKLVAAHRSIRGPFPFVDRIAATIYDAETRVLKTFLHSGDDADPMANYQALIDDAPSLKAILDRGLPRVINHQLTFEGVAPEHRQRLARHGYAASYTLPMFNNGAFVGFVFFNSRETDVFGEAVLKQLDIYGHLISLLIINELTSIRTLTAAVKTTGRITHARDPETGSHLDRMSRYSRLIAASLAETHGLDDSYIEHVFMFAPLHDIGKIGIPDNILLKPGKLNKDENAVMRTHARRGREMIDDLLRNFGLENFGHIDVLRNIAEYHHEAVNGTGYPSGIQGDAIPLEARIVAVADVFDALTSRRPYKDAWSTSRAIDTLLQLAGETLDRECVNALLENLEAVEKIQQQFGENHYG